MEDLSHMNLPDVDEYRTIFFEQGAVECDGETPDSCAKKIVNSSQPDFPPQFYLRHGRGALYNPFNVIAFYKNKSVWRFIKVNEDIFNLYIMFLKTRSEVHLTHAERQL